MFLPRALSTLTDAQNAVERLSDVFEAETMEARSTVDLSLPVAIRVQDATFRWVTAGGPGEEASPPVSSKQEKTKGKVAQPKRSLDTLVPPFVIEHLTLLVPRGRLVGIVGPVGSGKSSMLQGVSRGPLT